MVLERDLAAAEGARNFLAERVGRSRSTIVGGWDPVTGEVVAACADQLGCGEDAVVRALGLPNWLVQFTEAVRVRPGKLLKVPVCVRCQSRYLQSQFPPGTTYSPGGLWSAP